MRISASEVRCKDIPDSQDGHVITGSCQKTVVPACACGSAAIQCCTGGQGPMREEERRQSNMHWRRLSPTNTRRLPCTLLHAEKCGGRSKPQDNPGESQQAPSVDRASTAASSHARGAAAISQPHPAKEAQSACLLFISHRHQYLARVLLSELGRNSKHKEMNMFIHI